MASWQEVATALKQALSSGNAKESESAIALYEDTLGDDEELYVQLDPIKRTILTPEEAASVSEVGQGTEQDQEDAAVNASDQTPATTTINAGDEKSLDEVAEPILDEEDLNVTPAARKLAEEKDVDLSEVVGSGKDGRITSKDVEEAQA